MDTRVIEQIKNIVVSSDIKDISTVSFNATIDNVNFIPDVMTVKMISYCSADALVTPYNKVVKIYSDIVDDNWIGNITDVGSNTPNTTFLLRKPIKGQYVFKLFGVDNIPFNYIGNISINLEFVKYKEVKEGKIY